MRAMIPACVTLLALLAIVLASRTPQAITDWPPALSSVSDEERPSPEPVVEGPTTDDRSGDDLFAAALAGNVEARRRLIHHLDTLSGDAAHKQDVARRAVGWLKDLARVGDGRALLELARQSESGVVIPRDLISAYAYYVRAVPRLPASERAAVQLALDRLRSLLSDEELQGAKARAGSPQVLEE